MPNPTITNCAEQRGCVARPPRAQAGTHGCPTRGWGPRGVRVLRGCTCSCAQAPEQDGTGSGPEMGDINELMNKLIKHRPPLSNASGCGQSGPEGLVALGGIFARARLAWLPCCAVPTLAPPSAPEAATGPGVEGGTGTHQPRASSPRWGGPAGEDALGPQPLCLCKTPQQTPPDLQQRCHQQAARKRQRWLWGVSQQMFLSADANLPKQMESGSEGGSPRSTRQRGASGKEGKPADFTSLLFICATLGTGRPGSASSTPGPALLSRPPQLSPQRGCSGEPEESLGMGMRAAPALQDLAGVWVGSCPLGATQDLGAGKPDVVCTPSLPAVPSAARAAAGSGQRRILPHTWGKKGSFAPCTEEKGLFPPHTGHRRGQNALATPHRRGASRALDGTPLPSSHAAAPLSAPTCFPERKPSTLPVF